jgi:ABC-type antimicrobial peptide transport system permease subunit
MRKLIVGLVGLLAGLLVGFVAHELLARALTEDGTFPDSTPLAILVGFLTPVGAVAGVVAALGVDHRLVKHHSEGTP